MNTLPLHLTIISLLFTHTVSYPTPTDTINSTQIFRDNGASTLISSGGTFELGFFGLENSPNRYVGIWYKNIHEKTVVWVANRNNPLTETSGVLKFIETGILVLVNGTNHIIWSTNSSISMQTPVAQLLEQKDSEYGKRFATLDHHMGQLAKGLQERERSKFPSVPEPNPRENCKSVIVCRSKDGEVDAEGEELKAVEKTVWMPKWKHTKLARAERSPREKEEESASWGFAETVERLSYIKKKMEERLAQFVDEFKGLHVDMPFEEAMIQMPNYAQFLREGIAEKESVLEPWSTKLDVEDSPLVENELPEKLDDPGSFLLECDLEGDVRKKSLCDLGSGVNLMPLCIFEQLKEKELSPVDITIQFADQSLAVPQGVVRDVRVTVEDLTFSVDFVVLDMEEDEEVPIILGRPFLATAGAIMDIGRGEITLKTKVRAKTISVYGVKKRSKEERLMDKGGNVVPPFT